MKVDKLATVKLTYWTYIIVIEKQKKNILIIFTPKIYNQKLNFENFVYYESPSEKQLVKLYEMNKRFKISKKKKELLSLSQIVIDTVCLIVSKEKKFYLQYQ